MTRFLYIADTHLGASPMGYQQQKGYPERLDAIVDALKAYLMDIGGADFILHGGDMVDFTSEDLIQAAARLFALDVPLYLCLGNHDLTATNALDQWMALAPQFFPGGKPNYTIHCQDCVIHVAPNHWGRKPYYWKDTQEVHLLPDQTQALSRSLSTDPELPHILLTHSPIHGLPTMQTAMQEPYHAPPASFTKQITEIASPHDNIKCVLGAHNHMNMCVSIAKQHFVTASALIETPFEFKLFEVSGDSINMTTVSLDAALGFSTEYNIEKGFVQGRPEDRSLSVAV